MEEPTKIYSSNDPVKAQLIQSFLEKNKIEARILDRKDSAYVMLGEIAVFVDKKNADKARELVQKSEPESEDDL